MIYFWQIIWIWYIRKSNKSCNSYRTPTFVWYFNRTYSISICIICYISSFTVPNNISILANTNSSSKIINILVFSHLVILSNKMT